MHPIYQKDWSIVVNLGIKCNAKGIAVDADKRYISSPFDNMDSVDGLAEAGDLLARRFAGYFDDPAQWKARTVVRPEHSVKAIWHEDWPGLHYPHFHIGWFEGTGVNRLSLKAWIEDLEGTPDFIWQGFSARFGTRADRLVRIMDNGNKVLFLRIDEHSQMERLRSRDFEQDSHHFCNAIAAAFPGLDFGLLYYYSPDAQRPKPESTERICFEPITAKRREAEFVTEKLKAVRLRPIEELVVGEGVMSLTA